MKFKNNNIFFVTSFINFGLYLQLEANHAETLQPSELDIPLEDFFWTGGSGDGSSYVKPKDSSGQDVRYHNTIVRTATILATVYIDGNYDSDPLCIYDCGNDSQEKGIIESIDHIPPTDRRYWLLTVVTGLFNSQDFPLLEEKLAKLYRIAFLRQQAKHLGIMDKENTTLNVSYREKKQRERSATEIPSKPWILPTKTANGTEEITTRRMEINQNVYEQQSLTPHRQKRLVNFDVQFSQKERKFPIKLDLQSEDLNKYQKTRTNQSLKQKVSVVIHNLIRANKSITDEDGDSNDLNHDLPLRQNQTEIIYSVIVGGKPVLASAAAQDMRLVLLDEVIKIMENDIVLKAEPYLKEPQATPLAPSYMNGSSSVNEYVNQNPLLIAVTAIALFLFILLLLTSLLYGRSKRRLAAEAKLHNATQALVQKINVDDDINTILSESIEGVGVDNLAFESERNFNSRKSGPAVLHFPLPPAHRPTSASSTSDSSVYYPKRRQKIKDFFSDDPESKDCVDDTYSKIQAPEKNIKQEGKIHTRQRRKYRLENRVGSLEKADIHSCQLNDNDYFNNGSSIFQQHNEALNSNVFNYNSNKLLNDKRFSKIEGVCRTKDKSRRGELGITTEAFNKDVILHNERVKSADSNSIGSFLSMASIRSFPKCSLPEPLSRVLDPVSVTHLDHSDADLDTLKSYRMMDSKSLHSGDGNIVIHSDGSIDPGVVNSAILFRSTEMHKKNLEPQSSSCLNSPLRDPFVTRNRFEGLLEGAMKFYGSSSYSNCHSLMNENQDEDNMGQLPGVIKTKDNRRKSAATIRLTSRTSGLLSRTEFDSKRPMTAGSDFQSKALQNNVAPPIKAWTSGSGSLVRPLSSGVYHKPKLSVADEETNTDRTRAMSASPIIDAIQKELEKIVRD